MNLSFILLAISLTLLELCRKKSEHLEIPCDIKRPRKKGKKNVLSGVFSVRLNIMSHVNFLKYYPQKYIYLYILLYISKIYKNK